MKQKRLILEPYRTINGYDFLKHIFDNDGDAMHANRNLELLLDYLTCNYKRSDIGVDGKTMDICVYFDYEEAMFRNDAVNHKYYLFPITRREAIRRIYTLQEYMKDNEKILKLSLEVNIKFDIDAKYEIDDRLAIKINDTSIPKCKRIFIKLFRTVWRKTRLKFQNVFPVYYHNYDFHKPTPLSEYQLSHRIKINGETVEYLDIDTYHINKAIK